MNGYFRLICDESGTSVEVFPPTGDGTPAALSEIKEYLGNRNISYDAAALLNIIGKRENCTILINRDKQMEEREGYKLKISPDNMAVIVRFYPPSVHGEKITEKEFISDLAFNNIRFGIKEEEIKRFFDNRRYCEDIVVAEGKLPRHGTDAYIEYYFNTDLRVRPTLKDDGSVDFFHLNTINHCKKGDIIARLFPADPGEPGMNVLGDKVKPRDVKNKALKYGRNIALSEDKLTMTSEVNGHVTLVDDKVFVSDVFSVENVDNATGNIDYDGSVQINGNICANFSVKAKGNIEVQGVVEGAYVESGGDIIIARGMNGMNKGVLKAGGNVVVKFLENSTVTAGGYVSAESILHSTVQAGSEVTVSGKHGFITGGRVSALNQVTVKTLGSPMGADTIIEVGADPVMKLRIQELQKNIAEATKVLKSLHPLLKATQQKLARGVKLPPDQIQYLKAMIKLDQMKTEEVEAHTKEIENIQNSLSNCSSAQVIVTGTVFRGTRIGIGDLSMVVQSEMKYCRFIVSDGDMKMTAI